MGSKTIVLSCEIAVRGIWGANSRSAPAPQEARFLRMLSKDALDDALWHRSGLLLPQITPYRRSHDGFNRSLDHFRQLRSVV
jgi:hypothetical protein